MEDIAVLDFKAAMDRVDNDVELYFELIEMLDEDYKDSLGRIAEAIKAEDCKAVEAECHSIKSALGNLGAMKAYAVCQELEEKSRAANLADAATQIDVLRLSIDEFRQEVEKNRP